MQDVLFGGFGVLITGAAQRTAQADGWCGWPAGVVKAYVRPAAGRRHGCTTAMGDGCRIFRWPGTPYGSCCPCDASCASIRLAPSAHSLSRYRG
jgi:hypothetical protein